MKNLRRLWCVSGQQRWPSLSFNTEKWTSSSWDSELTFSRLHSGQKALGGFNRVFYFHARFSNRVNTRFCMLFLWAIWSHLSFNKRYLSPQQLEWKPESFLISYGPNCPPFKNENQFLEISWFTSKLPLWSRFYTKPSGIMKSKNALSLSTAREYLKYMHGNGIMKIRD